MGGGPLMAIPALLSTGMKLMGGGAQAAPAGGAAPASPFTAGLMGGPGMGGPQQPAPPPPMPERNPAFHDPAGDANGAKLISEQPGMRSLMGEALAKPRLSGDSANNFQAKPMVRGETIWGKDVTGQSFKPGGGQVVRPEPSPVAPVQASTANIQPRAATQPPPRIDLSQKAPPPTPAPMAGFDTSAPAAPGAPPVQQPVAPKPGLWDSLQANPIGTMQEKLKGMPTNPLAQVGMSLLSSGYDGSNPWTQMQAGLGKIPATEIALQSAKIAQQNAARADKKDGQEENDAALRALFAQMLAGGGMPGQEQGGQSGSRVSAFQARPIR
jgi:hypothetical protein